MIEPLAAGSGAARPNLSAAAALAAALARHGVTLTFGQSIPSAFHLAAADIGIRQIGYRTENAGAAMADGYARIANRVAVVTAQNGPAATLLVPGLAEAYKASVPVLAIVQDVARATVDRNAFQEIDHFDLFRACAKWVRRVAVADRIDDYVDMAFAAASSGRPGPAVLLCPVDMLGDAVATGGHRTARLGHSPLDPAIADPERIEAAAALLAGAERPLVIAGGGCHLSGAQGAVAGLQERTSLPVATTLMGKGAVDERHPLSLGVVGYTMGRLGMAHHLRPMIEGADAVLLIGTRTNQNGTDSWSLLPREARLVHLDIDGAEVGRNYEAMRLVGDARLTLEALSERLDRMDLGKRRAARPAVERRIAAGRAAHVRDATPVLESNAVPIRPERMMADVRAVLEPSTITVADANYASVWVGNYLHALRPGMRFLTPRGLAGLGWGLPMALGAKLAAPESAVLCFVGDGGFGHVWSELETARRMGIEVVVTVFSNQILGFQRDAEDTRFGRHTDAIYFEPVDHAGIARDCGCLGVRVERPEDYAPALAAAMAAERTTVIDAIVDPDAKPPLTLFE